MTNKNELATNLSRWATVAKNELPPDVGFIMIAFPKTGGDLGACISNVPNDQVRTQLKDTLRRFSEQSIIWTPN